MYGQYTVEGKMLITACMLVTIAMLFIYALIERRMTSAKVIKSQKNRKINNFEDLRKKYATNFEIRDFRKNFNM